MAKVGYVTLGTNDVAKAASFYDALLGSIGHVRVFEDRLGCQSSRRNAGHHATLRSTACDRW